MKTLLTVILLLAMPLGCLQGGKVRAVGPGQTQVKALVAKLSAGNIKRIEIFRIPDRVLTRTRITPEMLERQFQYQFTIRDVRGGVFQTELIDAMKSISVMPREELADLRWGMVLYGPDDSRVGALYFDKSGKSGAVGTTPVSFEGNLFKWLDANFSECFQ